MLDFEDLSVVHGNSVAPGTSTVENSLDIVGNFARDFQFDWCSCLWGICKASIVRPVFEMPNLLGRAIRRAVDFRRHLTTMKPVVCSGVNALDRTLSSMLLYHTVAEVIVKVREDGETCLRFVV